MNLKASLFIALFVGALASCGSPADPGPPLPPAAGTLELDRTAAEVNQGDTVRFRATVKDASGSVITGAAIVWRSSDPGHVTVDSTGLVGAIAEPASLVTITASYEPRGGTARSASAVVSVTALHFDLYPSENALIPGMTRALVARLAKSYSGYPGPSVELVAPTSWSTSDPAIVTVDGVGKLTGISAGHAQVTATYKTASGAIRTSTADVWVDAASAPLHFISVYGSQTQTRKSDLFGPSFDSRACGLTDTGDVYCWGVAQPWMTGHLDWCDRTARLGPASYGYYAFRCTDVPRKLPSDVKFKALATSGDQSCAIDVSGRVWCWGSNRNGALGIGVADTLEYPLTLIASNDAFTQLALGEVPPEITTLTMNCALRTDRVAVCWENAFGVSPKPVTGVTFRSLTDTWPCGLAADSTAYCLLGGTSKQAWGAMKWVAAQSQISGPLCALDASSTVYCGAISGPPSARTLSEPIVSLGTYNESTASMFRSIPCGLTAAGDMYCFDKAAPRLVNPGGMRLRQFFGHCGIALDRKAYCWKSGAWTVVPGQ